MNSKVYREILSAQVQSNDAEVITEHFTVQMNNYLKGASKATQGFLKAII